MQEGVLLHSDNTTFRVLRSLLTSPRAGGLSAHAHAPELFLPSPPEDTLLILTFLRGQPMPALPAPRLASLAVSASALGIPALEAWVAGARGLLRPGAAPRPALSYRPSLHAYAFSTVDMPLPRRRSRPSEAMVLGLSHNDWLERRVLLASGNVVRLLSPSFAPIAELRGHRPLANVASLAVHPRLDLALSGDSLGEARLWSLNPTPRCILSLLPPAREGSPNPAVDMVLSQGLPSMHALYPGLGNTLASWDMHTGQLTSTLEVPEKAEVGRVVEAGDHILVCGGVVLHVYDMRSGQRVAVLDNPRRAMSVERMAMVGSVYVACDGPGTASVHIADLRFPSKPQSLLRLPATLRFLGHPHPSSSLLAAHAEGLLLWDVSASAPLPSAPALRLPLSWAPDAEHVREPAWAMTDGVVLCEDGLTDAPGLHMWELQTSTEPAVWPPVEVGPDDGGEREEEEEEDGYYITEPSLDSLGGRRILA